MWLCHCLSILSNPIAIRLPLLFRVLHTLNLHISHIGLVLLLLRRMMLVDQGTLWRRAAHLPVKSSISRSPADRMRTSLFCDRHDVRIVCLPSLITGFFRVDLCNVCFMVSADHLCSDWNLIVQYGQIDVSYLTHTT